MEKQSKKKTQFLYARVELKVSDWYMNNGRNIARTSQMFGVNRKQVRTWLKHEEKIQQQKHYNRAVGRGCIAKFPFMEKALYAECKEARAEGKLLKRLWFNLRAKQLVQEQYPGIELRCSDQWFWRFCRRYGRSGSSKKDTSHKLVQSI